MLQAGEQGSRNIWPKILELYQPTPDTSMRQFLTCRETRGLASINRAMRIGQDGQSFSRILCHFVIFILCRYVDIQNRVLTTQVVPLTAESFFITKISIKSLFVCSLQVFCCGHWYCSCVRTVGLYCCCSLFALGLLPSRSLHYTRHIS